MAGVVFEISVVMVARDPVDPAAAADFATRLLIGGLDHVPKRQSFPQRSGQVSRSDRRGHEHHHCCS